MSTRWSRRFFCVAHGVTSRDSNSPRNTQEMYCDSRACVDNAQSFSLRSVGVRGFRTHLLPQNQPSDQLHWWWWWWWWWWWVREAYLNDVSRRKVDDLVQAPRMRATDSGELVADDFDEESR